MRLVIIFSVILIVKSEYYDTFTGREISKTRYDSFSRINLVPMCAIEVAPCNPKEVRRLDNSCNNLKFPSRGAHYTPFLRMLPANFNSVNGVRVGATGRALPNARALRVALMSDGRRVSPNFTHLVTHFSVAIVADVTSVHDTTDYIVATTHCCSPAAAADPRCTPITVLPDDIHLRTSGVRCLNMTRPMTYQDLGCVGNNVPPERLNLGCPMLELSVVYGTEQIRANRGRTMVGGRLRAEQIQGKEWPPTPTGPGICLLNRPGETRCHDGPSLGMNSLLGINIISMWFYRLHNDIARKLEAINPCWSDDKLFYTARELNIAFFNQITYYELMVELLGKEYMLKRKLISSNGGHFDDYNEKVEPRVSLEFVTATRWFHTIQEGRYKLYTNKGKLYDEVSVVDFTLRTGGLAVNNTLQGMTQGAFRQPMADHDQLIDPDLGERSLSVLQTVSDLGSADIMKGRTLGLAFYNEYRKLCNLTVADEFEDMLGWMSQESVDVLSRQYTSPSDVELMSALLTERASPPSLVPPTLACVISDQLARWRQGDRFWYEHKKHNPTAFTAAQLAEIRKMTLAKVICSQGDDVITIQPNVFRLTGPGNKMVKCSDLEMPNFQVFRDKTCTNYELGHR